MPVGKADLRGLHALHLLTSLLSKSNYCRRSGCRPTDRGILNGSTQGIGGSSKYQSIRISLRDEGSEGFTLETVRNWDAPLKMRIANEASGRFGQVTRYSLGNHALVTRSGANYVVTNYIQNFRLIATLKSDSSSCQVDVTYPLNEKETIYIMGSRTGETYHFSLISAKDVRCSVKSLGES